MLSNIKQYLSNLKRYPLGDYRLFLHFYFKKGSQPIGDLPWEKGELESISVVNLRCMGFQMKSPIISPDELVMDFELTTVLQKLPFSVTIPNPDDWNFWEPLPVLSMADGTPDNRPAFYDLEVIENCIISSHHELKRKRNLDEVQQKRLQQMEKLLLLRGAISVERKKRPDAHSWMIQL